MIKEPKNFAQVIFRTQKIHVIWRGFCMLQMENIVDRIDVVVHLGVGRARLQMNTVKSWYSDKSGYRKVNLVNSRIFDIRPKLDKRTLE
jgi:hypothetical protein